MQIIKVTKFCMVCCLKSIYFAIFLLPLISAETLTNGTSATSVYRPWKTISSRVPILVIVRNISHQYITSAVETGTFATMYNVYFFLYVHQHLRRSFHNILRNVENYNKTHDTTNYIPCLNNSKNLKENEDSKKYEYNNGKINDFSRRVKQYWNRKELTLKSRRDIAGVECQIYCDDIFELALYMITAIFIEFIPITIRYACKKTALCWRRLFCCFYHRNYTKTPYLRQYLHQRHRAVINCVCDVLKLSTIKFKRRSDQQQKHVFILHQKHLTIFAVITGEIFALFIHGVTTQSPEISVPALADSLYISGEKLIIFHAVPTMMATTAIIAQNCRKFCHHYLLKAVIINPITFSFYAQIIADHRHCIIMPKEIRLLPKQITYLIWEIQQLRELDISCHYKYFVCGGKIIENKFVYAANENKDHTLRHNLRSFAILLLLIDDYDTVYENYDNNFAKSQNNCYLKLFEEQLLKISKDWGILSTQMNNFIIGFQKKVKYGRDISVIHTNSIFKELQSGAKRKSKPNFGKHIKPMKLTKGSPYWNVPFRSAATFTCQRIQDKSTDWKKCLQAIIKFDLCCCCWCFYCYRRNSISERVSSGFCNKWYRCYPWYRRQYAHKSPHCIYCYYYLLCYYSLNQYCCYSKISIKSVMYPCNCSSNKSNRDFRKYCPNIQRNEKKIKEQRVLQQLKCFRNVFRPQYPTNANCISSTLSALYFCHRIYWFQNTQNCCSHITKPNTLVNTMNSVKVTCAVTISNKKIDFINSIRSTAIYLGKCVYNELIKLEDYIRRHIVIVLQIKISIPRSTALVIKVTRDQQQQQMVNIAHDQQLKMNYLCKIFCNNWKRHRRRKRRRRRRRMNKQEQQQHQSVRLQQQHINNEKKTLLSGINNSRLHILDFNACKAIATNVPVHMILSKAPTVTMLAAMRFTNTKIALTDGNRKDVISPSQTPALISSPSLTTTASTRLNRSRSRPNLVWLFIGLVWFEGPKYVNCGIQSSSQSSQSNPQSQSQPQTATHAAETTLEPLPTSVLLSPRQQHKIPPPRITSNLLLLTPNYKKIFKGSKSFIQKGSIAAIADTAKYKMKPGAKSSLNGKVMHIGNCLSPRRRASIMATKTKRKLTRSYDNDSIMITDRKRFNRLEPGANVEANFLDEEAHSAHSDHARLESIKRQILTKLGLKQKPNVSHPLPKQFIWDTIYRADGIRSVVSDFDFSENGSHRMELMSEVNSTKETRRSNSAKANDITNLLLNSRGFQNGEFANTIGLDAEKVFNVSYKDYLHHARFDESKILNDSKITNNFTYLMHISKPKPNKNFLGVDEPGYSDIIYNDKDDLLETETDELNYKVNHGIHNVDEAYSYAENRDGYSLQHRKYPLSADQNKYERDDFQGDTQELIIFAEKGKMIKQHRLVEFAPQTKYMSNEKFFVRKAEIHIRIDKLTTGCNDNSDRKNRGCGGNKTKPKLWIFQVMENNTTKKSCDNSPQLCVTYDVDIMNLGWQKFDITLTVRDWYTRAPTEKLRLLIDCTGCGKHYILHLFNQPLENSKHKLLYLQREKRYRSVKRNDLVVHWRQPLLNRNIISERHSDVKEQVEQRPKAKISLLCNNIFNCNTKKNFTSKIDNYKLNNVRTKLFRPHVLLGYLDQYNRLQPQVPQARGKQHVNSQPQKYTRLKDPISSELSPNRPFLVLRTETRRLRRVRRRAIDCVGAIHGQCCKESFYVSFKALGWDDWIIAPRGYFANYCRGDCTGPFRTPDTFQTFHAHFIEEYRKMGLLNGMQPCCAPVKFSSMSLIYYGDDGIIKRDLPKMVVDECGCP
ncbi:uncharacterized protein LOC105225728 isoform X7 [Bactrocera dorsalis]|uniref:Uncharacterized protein LOC105225728 isoform X7 n=2 Tax=Bactrocera dorsalis TaxID=27457 RepID=A0A8N4L573_BACDO|nr:uncharacterized protein LOC105225728 isoform X7 [Bactrocera dorsalis]